MRADNLRVESNERFDWLMGLIFCYFSKDHNKIQTYGANMQSEFTTELSSGLILITGSSTAKKNTVYEETRESDKHSSVNNFL